MTITLSRADYDQLWRGQNLKPEIATHSGFSESRQIVPKQLGQGCVQRMRWQGVHLALFHYQLHEDVYVVEGAQTVDHRIGEIGFQLSGYRCGKRTGENFIYWGSCGMPAGCEWVTYAKDPVLKVDINIESHDCFSRLITDTLKELTLKTRQCMENDVGEISEINVITPAMRSPLEQIFHCPFQGRTKQMYLEGKCLELIALKLEQLKTVDQLTRSACTLKPDDIDRIHYAKDILTADLENPPSLMELAQRVSLNDFKLKGGFRQIFGTTVFGYLHRHRMETARQLLAEQRMNVSQVAHTVGYANQSRFAAAFRKQFGMNPKTYQLGKKSG